MPFVSEKQRRYLYSQKPEIAEKFAEHSKKKKKSKERESLKKSLTATTAVNAVRG